MRNFLRGVVFAAEGPTGGRFYPKRFTFWRQRAGKTQSALAKAVGISEG
jgi:DNA-binding XRE family transcriptional regulator